MVKYICFLFCVVFSYDVYAQKFGLFQANVSGNIHDISIVEQVDSQSVLNKIERGGNFYLQNSWSWPIKLDSIVEHRIGIVNSNYITWNLVDKSSNLNIWPDKYFGLSNSLGLGYIRRKRFSKFYGQTEVSANAYVVNLFNNLEEKKHTQTYVHFGVQCSQSILFKLFNSVELGPFISMQMDYKNRGYQDHIVNGFNGSTTTNGQISLVWKTGIAIRL